MNETDVFSPLKEDIRLDVDRVPEDAVAARILSPVCVCAVVSALVSASCSTSLPSSSVYVRPAASLCTPIYLVLTTRPAH